MGGKKYRDRMNRAKQMATATAAIVPPPSPVQRPPAPSHTCYELDTETTLADKLARAIDAFKDDIRRNIGLWAAIEFGSDSIALVAAAMRGDAKAQLAIVMTGTQHVSSPENTKVSELALYQKNPGVELWFGMDDVQYILSRAYASPNERIMIMLKVGDGATKHLIASARSGSTYAPKAQYVLGIFIYQSVCGSGEWRDITDFLRQNVAPLIRKAAKQSLMEAQYELGKMFRHGIFCDVHARFARRYIRRASKQGHVDATACMKELRSCVFCGVDDAPLACSRCREARYCDSRCSEKHWCDGSGVGRDVVGDATDPHRDVCPRSLLTLAVRARRRRSSS